MATKKGITLSPAPTPGLTGRPQSRLDWNVRRKPAVTPRREYSNILPESWMLLDPSATGGFGPIGGQAVIQ